MGLLRTAFTAALYSFLILSLTLACLIDLLSAFFADFITGMTPHLVR